jgi:hypothetical protein
MTLPDPTWETWAPPLDPPTAGGLSADLAAQIADAYWATSPHLAAALMWEAYAAQLEPTQPVTSVSTGAQSVGFDPAAATGPYGAALQQAEWHRSFLVDTYTVPMSLVGEYPAVEPVPAGLVRGTAAAWRVAAHPRRARRVPPPSPPSTSDGGVSLWWS